MKKPLSIKLKLVPPKDDLKQTQINFVIDKEKNWEKKVQQKRLEDLERITKFKEKAIQRGVDEDKMTANVTLVGPISAYYFDNLELSDGSVKNILLLGDLHNNIHVSEHCCMKTEKIKNKFEKLTLLIYIIVGVHEVFKRANIKDKNELLDIILYVQSRAEKLKKLFNKIDTTCMSIIDYLYLLGNNKNCIDIFDESWETVYNEPQFTPDKGYLGMTRILFKLCRINLCNHLFNSVRFHYTNIRIYMNNPELEQKLKAIEPNISLVDIKNILKTNPYFTNPSIKKTLKLIIRSENTNKKDVYSNRTFLTLMYIQYLFDNSEYYKKVYLDKMDQESLKYSLEIDNLIKKQFEKSIFYGNAHRFIEAITHIFVNEYLFSNTNVFDMLETLRMDIYQICRMFVRKDQWKKRESTSVKLPTENCRDSTYPKNIVSYTGDLHTLFLKKFILHYFPDSISHLKINKKSRYSRCLKLDYLPFL